MYQSRFLTDTLSMRQICNTTLRLTRSDDWNHWRFCTDDACPVWESDEVEADDAPRERWEASWR